MKIEKSIEIQVLFNGFVLTVDGDSYAYKESESEAMIEEIKEAIGTK